MTGEYDNARRGEGAVARVTFRGYDTSVPEALDAAGARELLTAQERVLIKPNLVNTSPPPVTTPVECVEAVVRYVQSHSEAEVVIAEGCGDCAKETAEVFAELGYTAMARKLGVRLLDLNLAPTRTEEREACTVFPSMTLPESAFTHFVLSVPMLKAHSFSRITGTLKNMIGFAPPDHYSGGGAWKKAAFHTRMHQSITDLNRYVTPDLTLMDATVGLADYHLGGRHCDPPVNALLASADPLALDREAAGLLGLDWRSVDHLR